MRMTLIGCKGNSVNIFPQLIKSLSKNIAGLEINERFVPFFEDIPLVALESSTESEFILVFALLDSKKEIDFLKKKLVDVEIKSKVRILKYIMEDDFAGLNEDNVAEMKEEVVKELTKTVVGILFNEMEFMPDEKNEEY